MGKVIHLKGPEAREVVVDASGPMRRPDFPGAGRQASQSLGEVVDRLLAGLTVSESDHGNVRGVWVSPGEND